LKLQDKNINIDGNTYKVEKQVIDKNINTETIILTRKLNLVIVSSIFDLGYKSEKEILYSDKDMEDVIDMIDVSINQEVELAIIDTSGLISISNVILKGLSLHDGNQYKVSFIEPASTNNPTVLIELDFLAKSILLASEFMEAKSNAKEKSNVYDEVLDAAEDNLKSKVKEDIIDEKFNEVFKKFDKLFKDIDFGKSSSDQEGVNINDALKGMNINDIFSTILGKGSDGK
jgi:hypothetical protein